MGLIADILKAVRGSGETDTLEGCDSALRRVADERAVAVAAIANHSSRRRALLLEDASDKQIALLDREIDGHRLTLERLELVEGDLFSRMNVLRNERRNAQVKALLGRYVSAAQEFVTAMRSAVRAFNKVRDIRQEAIEAGFGTEFNVFPSLINVIEPAAVSNYEAEIERVAEALAGRTPPMPVQPVRLPAVDRTPPAEPASMRAVRRGEVIPGGGAVLNPEPKTAAARAARIDTSGPDQVLLHVLRSGYEDPDGFQCQGGDVIALPAETARMASLNGVGEIVAMPPADRGSAK